MIGNEKLLLIKKKVANPSTLGMYYGGKNQEPKLQWSSNQEGKNKKNATKPHSKQEKYARKSTTFKNFLKRDKDKCLT